MEQSKVTLMHEDNNRSTTIVFDGEPELSEYCELFTSFLSAVGYTIDGVVTIVNMEEDEKEIAKIVKERDDLEAEVFRLQEAVRLYQYAETLGSKTRDSQIPLAPAENPY